jgi:hypothetical protein
MNSHTQPSEQPLEPLLDAPAPALCYCLHVIDTTGRHYVFNIDQEPLTMLVNQDQYVWSGRDNNLHNKFVDLYHKLIVEKQPVCVLTPTNSLMISSSQITGIQLTQDFRY